MSRKRSTRSVKARSRGHNRRRARPEARPFLGLPARALRLEMLEDRRLLSPAPFVSFAAKQDISANIDSTSVSLGDLNGDGKRDLVVASESASRVSVFLNTTAPGASTPTFAAKQDFTTGASPSCVSLGDLNGDGKLDMVVANSNSNTVSVFLNTTAPGATTPSFAARQDFATGTNPITVAIGDLNGDGKPDLVVTNINSETVSVFLNTTAPGATTPSFAAKQDFATGVWPQSVSLGDINGDGKPDLVVTNRYSNTVSVLLNTTTPGATTPSFAAKQDFATGSGPVSVRLADLNGDGKPDLVVTNRYSNTVSVLLNTTTPGASTPSFAFDQQFTTGSSPGSVSVGDLNGDGRPDLAVTNYGSNTVSVLLNTTAPGATTPSFAAKQDFTTGTNPGSVSVGDLNGDGKPDLAVTNWNSSTVSVLLNTTPWVSAFGIAAKQDFTTGTHPESVTLGDINGDGKPDLAVANLDSNTVSVLLNTTAPGATTPSFAAKQDFTTGTYPISVSLGDLNGDGKPDLVVANETSNTVSVLLNTTAPGATTPSFAAKQDFTTGEWPIAVSIRDINGDGKPDLVVANAGSDTVSVLLNTTAPGATTPSFAAKQNFSTGWSPFAVSLGDLNGDGKSDLVVASSSYSYHSTMVSVLLNTTAPGATTPTFAPRQDFVISNLPASYATSVSMGDVNGDGKLDLVVANHNPDTVAVLLNTTVPGATTASFAAKQVFTTGTWPTSVVLGDFNGDGKPDLAVANSGSGTVSVLLNTTAPGATTASFAAKQDFTTGSSPVSVSMGDLNGDGKPDLVVADANSNTVSALLNTSVELALPTVTVTDNGGPYNGSAFAATNATVTGLPPDGVIANFGAASLSYTYYLGATPLGGAPKDPGSYTVVAHYTSNNPYYASADSAPVAFTITPVALSIKTDNQTAVYGAALPTLTATYSGFVNGETSANLTTLPTITTTATASSPISIYPISVGGAVDPDYTISYVTGSLFVIAPPMVSLAAKQDFTTAGLPFSVSMGDLNGDGKPDLVVANSGSNTVSVFLNTTAPGATTPSFAAKQDFDTGSGPYSVSLADLNGDGKPDLVVANYSSNTVSVLLNTTAPGATTPSFAANQVFTTGSGPFFVSVADLNGDGKPDLAVANRNSNTVSVLLNTTTPGATTPSFAAKQDFGTGSSPRCVSLGDLNGDGKPDLIVANYSSNTVSVLLNTTTPGATTPSFAAKHDFTTGSGPFSVSLADLNGDGKPDLAVANFYSSTVSVLLNTTATGATAPSFAAKQDFTTGSGPFSVSLADLNGDGKPDLAVANRNSNTVSVLLNMTTPGTATSSFAAKQDFATGLAPVSVSWGDLNGDGKPDLATANSSLNTVSVLLNTTPWVTAFGLAAKQDFTAGSSPVSVSLGDLNGDGKPDLVVANLNSKTVSVFLNTTAPGVATPSFAAKQDFTTDLAPVAASLGDLNGDGKPDLIVANMGSNTVSVLLNTTAPGAATPTFAAKHDFTTGSYPVSVAVGDLNGDGKPDLVVANRASNTVSVFLNTTAPGATTPSFAAKQDFTTGAWPSSVRLADINGDGKPDLIVTDYSSNTVSVLLNTTAPGATTPSFAAKQDFTTGSGPYSVSFADLNGDGKPDLAVANMDSNTVSVLLNTTAPGAATPSFAAKQDFVTGTRPGSVSLGDLNGDGKPDLVVANFGSNTVSAFLNTTAPGAATPSFAAKQDFATGTSPPSVSVGDLNGDGRPDLALANVSSNTVSVLLNTSVGLAVPTVSVTDNGGPYDGSAFAATNATVTGLPPDGVIANFGDASLSYTYYLGATPLGGAPRDPGSYTVVAHYTSNNPSYASTDSAPVAFTISPATLTVTGITANDKVYDGTTAATLNVGGAALVGVMSGDTVTLNTSCATGTFASPNEGDNILVTVSGLTLGGAQTADYTLTQPTTTANITPFTVTINQAASQTDPTSSSPINFTVVFGVAVTDFVTGDVTLSSSTTGGTLVGMVTGNGTTYNVAVSGMAGAGTVIASIAAGVAHDVAGNANVASTSTDNSVVFDPTPATVVSTVVNGGALGGGVQRSMVDNVTVTFSQIVTMQTGAFQVMQKGSGGLVTVAVASTVVNNETVATLTFSGAYTQYASLMDGEYELTIFGNLVQSAASGTNLDGANTGQFGSNYVFGAQQADNFYRLYGDIEGQRTVDAVDLFHFRQSLLTPANYQWYLDFYNDGYVDATDLFQFRLRLLKPFA